MPFLVELSAGLAAKAVEIGLEKFIEHKRNYFTNTFERIKDGSLGIFVFGPQGVGKTTLMNVLSGDSSINDVPPEYLSSSENEKKAFGGHV